MFVAKKCYYFWWFPWLIYPLNKISFCSVAHIGEKGLLKGIERIQSANCVLGNISVYFRETIWMWTFVGTLIWNVENEMLRELDM